ncbi:MAG: uracil-DNA glycosylase [Bacillota bacterium]|nr:uracil-DNA glycosylase [Bacillota bacterium]MDW7682842.1 uracil-DNA glycosylase [Bacillota bacterium]
MKQKLEQLKEACSECRSCGLGDTRQHVVFGEGNPDADIFILGEAPGAREDETGRPFVGRAGEVLTELLAQAGIKRDDVFITGSCKCRPPKNRNPRRSELKACLPIVEKQLELIRPKVLICLGLVAVQNILDPKTRLADVRGRWFDGPGYKIYATYHPAAVLRGTVKADILVEDFKRVKEALTEN